MRTSNYVLNAVAAAAADMTLAGSLLTIKADDANTQRVFDYQLIKKGSVVKEIAVAEVLQVSTVTFTYAANTVFSFSLQQYVAGKLLSNVITIDTTNANISSAARMAELILKKVTALGYQITPSGAGSPVTLTAITRYPKFTVTNVSNTTIATTTTAVYSKHIYQDLVDQGITGGIAGNVYTRYRFIAGKQVGEMFGVQSELHNEEVCWFLNEGDGDTAALITRLDRWLSGLDNAGTGVNQEAFSQT